VKSITLDEFAQARVFPNFRPIGAMLPELMHECFASVTAVIGDGYTRQAPEFDEGIF
jgi:hypothetical protein